VEEGGWEMGDGRWEMEDGRLEMEKGRGIAEIHARPKIRGLRGS